MYYIGKFGDEKNEMAFTIKCKKDDIYKKMILAFKNQFGRLPNKLKMDFGAVSKKDWLEMRDFLNSIENRNK